MEKRILGATGLEVTIIGFGAMTIGEIYGPVDDSESNRALHASIDNGMNFIDTSDAYGQGHSESVIGKFLKERQDSQDILVFTKGGNNMVTGNYDYTPEYIGSCLEASLQRLGVDRIDYYQLHNPTIDNMMAEDSYALLDKAKQDGKVSHWGVSVNTKEECNYVTEQGTAACLQMEYNIISQEATESFSRAKSANVGIISRVPLKRGFLSGRIDETFEFVEGDRRSRILSADNIRKFQSKLNKLKDISSQLGISPAETAIRFCVSNSDVSCVIPGIRTAEQAKENCMSCEPLPAEAMKQLVDTN